MKKRSRAEHEAFHSECESNEPAQQHNRRRRIMTESDPDKKQDSPLLFHQDKSKLEDTLQGSKQLRSKRLNLLNTVESNR